MRSGAKDWIHKRKNRQKRSIHHELDLSSVRLSREMDQANVTQALRGLLALKDRHHLPQELIASTLATVCARRQSKLLRPMKEGLHREDTHLVANLEA